MKVVSLKKKYQWFPVFVVPLCFLNGQFVNGQEEQAQSNIIVSLIYGVGIPWDVQGGFMTTGYAIRVPYSFPMKIKEWRPPFARSLKIRKNVMANKKQTKADKNVKNNKVSFKNKAGANKHKKSTNTNISNEGKIGNKMAKQHGKKKREKGAVEDDIRRKFGPIHGHLNPDYHRWAAYKVLEVHASRAGFEGRPCVLRSICEVALIPFDSMNKEWGELLHILFTPSSSQEPLSKHSDLEYFHAEFLGKSGAPCERIFKECKKSLVDTFTRVVLEEIPANM